MAKERKCECCEKTTKETLSNFHNIDWSAFQIGNKEAKCFCPEHTKYISSHVGKEFINKKPSPSTEVAK